MTVEAHAKINLTLEVFGKRRDGYHALRSVVAPISLADTLTISEAKGFVSDTGYADDLCLKAAKALDPKRGVEIRVRKRIPAGGGLGGGSADAAATLVALNRMRKLGLARSELAALGAKVGSDVPALTMGEMVIMEGRGELVSELPFDPPKPLNLVLAFPGVTTSTAEVYARCRPRKAGSESATVRMLEALEGGKLEEIAAAFENDLIAPATKLQPKIAMAMEALKRAGAVGVSMSGSGSTAFGLFSSARKALSSARKLRESGLEALAVRTI